MAGWDSGTPSRTIGVRTHAVRGGGVSNRSVRRWESTDRGGGVSNRSARRPQSTDRGVRRGESTDRGVRRLGVSGLASALLISLLLAGCGQEPAVLPDGPVANPLPTVNPAEERARDEVRAAFAELRQAQITVYADPQPPYLAQVHLVDHLADPLLAVTLFEVDLLYRRGLVRQGDPSWQATVTALDLTGSPPTATVRDCVDASGWQVGALAGGPASVAGLPARFALDAYVMEYDARLDDGSWLFEDARMQEDEQC